jgi:pyrimidine-nucleoside phosphorylase
VIDDYGPAVGSRSAGRFGTPRDGFLVRLDAESVGRASVVLGAGRDRVEDPVDPAVGIIVRAKPGDAVRAGDPVLEMHYRDRGRLETAMQLVTAAIVVGDERPAQRPLIVGEVR